jgi:hypothetical protein
MDYTELMDSKDKYIVIPYDLLSHIQSIFKKADSIKKESSSISHFKRVKKDINSTIKEILNKLTESNMHQLTKEFLTNVGQVNDITFNIIQKIIYDKCIEDSSFIYVYIKFLRILYYVYNKVQNYTINEFIDIAIKDILKNQHESKRQTAMIIFHEMTIQHLVTNNLTEEIIKDSIDYSDIYHWLKICKISLSESYKELIKQRIKNVDLSKRNSILIKEILA